MNILGISGSVRTGSFNQSLLMAMRDLLPADATFVQGDIANLPFYNQDLEKTAYPAIVQKLKDQITAADAIIITTPEYNRSIPGMLKNAIDWTSRPKATNAWNKKPVLVLGASDGAIGTAVAQAHLKQIMVTLNARVPGQPELFIGKVNEKLKDGVLVDEVTKEHLAKGVAALLEFVR